MPVFIVMGVAGSGKSTVGSLLAQRLGVPFFDGDDFHPEANRQKMAAGNPLNDDDRRPWLLAMAAEFPRWNTQGGAVLACSALKESYRELLKSQTPEVSFIHLHGTPELLRRRLETREGHYMKPGMLASQLATLEPPTHGAIVLDIVQPPEVLVEQALDALAIRKNPQS